MTEPTRGARARRGNRRPGSLLLTLLLVLAIAASSVLVFTNEVQLLKLAVVISLWAAVVAAFVSFIYRRQADLDQAKSRDLKLVYDLQLDREISARREYELSIESQLRRELASELRAETSDEVAALRAELAALRANLEMIFDTDLRNRPALETERTAVHTFGDWGDGRGAVEHPDDGERSTSPGRVFSSRIDTEAPDDSEPNTEESPIIDVPAVPDVPAEPPAADDEWAAQDPGGAHRRASERPGGPGLEAADNGWRVAPPEPSRPDVRQEGRRRAPESAPADVSAAWNPPEPSPQPLRRPEPEPEPEPAHVQTESEWTPAPAEGVYIPAGRPGSNWVAPTSDDATPTPTPAPTADPEPEPEPEVPPAVGRHHPAETAAGESGRAARHSSDADPGRPDPEPVAARHRGADEVEEASGGQHIGGQPVSELMARLQVSSTGGGRRRRRDE